MVLLAGDIVGGEVVEVLSRFAPVEAVQGNFCHADLKKRLPVKKVLDLDGWRVGLTHGNLGEGSDADEMSLSLFKEDAVDVVVHGHTHHHHQTTMKGTLVVEPGSLLDTRFTRTNSYAIMKLGDTIKVEFVVRIGRGPSARISS